VIEAVLGYLRLLSGCDVEQIDIEVAVSVVSPNDIIFGDRGIGVIERTTGYGYIGQYLEVEHLDVRIVGSFPVIGPDHSSFADRRLHLDAAWSKSDICTGLDIIEIDVRVVVEVGDVAAIDPGIGLYA